MSTALIIPAFIAGLLTFLAPCTLPLVPGFLAFISGVKPGSVMTGAVAVVDRRRIFLNAVGYVLGFSVVFITLGILFGLGGAALVQYRVWFSRIGGVFVIAFGLYLLGFAQFKWLRFLNVEKRFHPSNSNAFILGATFALGWSPCVGPILGSILFIAWSTATVAQGALLLGVFSLGLAIPFLVLAATIGTAFTKLKRLHKHLPAISRVGGLLLVFLGALLLFNQLNIWTAAAFRWLNIFNYDKLLDYL